MYPERVVTGVTAPFTADTADFGELLTCSLAIKDGASMTTADAATSVRAIRRIIVGSVTAVRLLGYRSLKGSE